MNVLSSTDMLPSYIMSFLMEGLWIHSLDFCYMTKDPKVADSQHWIATYLYTKSNTAKFSYRIETSILRVDKIAELIQKSLCMNSMNLQTLDS
jgi:hypothetical protein